MAPLGPFSAGREVAVAVSGGPDSLALGWLAARWGRPLALVVDHGLRREAAAEAAVTVARLAGFGVGARVLRLGLSPGTGAAAARAARYAALTTACREAGLAHLLLGHQRGDQAETLLLREAHGSGAAGRAAMAAWRAEGGVALLRPLLGIGRGRLLATLEAAGLGWVTDPSNADPRAERARLRRALDDPAGSGPRTLALAARAARFGAARGRQAAAMAAWIAAEAGFHPGPSVRLPEGAWPAAVLSALIRLVAGRAYPPAAGAVAALAAAPRPATLGGARLLRASGGFWLGREAAAMAPPVAAVPGMIWDGRHRVAGAAPAGAWLGPLGPGHGRAAGLPAALAATLPALWREGRVIAAPALGHHLPGVTIRPSFRAAAVEPFTFAGQDGDALDGGRPYVLG